MYTPHIDGEIDKEIVRLIVKYLAKDKLLQFFSTKDRVKYKLSGNSTNRDWEKAMFKVYRRDHIKQNSSPIYKLVNVVDEENYCSLLYQKPTSPEEVIECVSLWNRIRDDSLSMFSQETLPDGRIIKYIPMWIQEFVCNNSVLLKAIIRLRQIPVLKLSNDHATNSIKIEQLHRHLGFDNNFKSSILPSDYKTSGSNMEGSLYLQQLERILIGKKKKLVDDVQRLHSDYKLDDFISTLSADAILSLELRNRKPKKQSDDKGTISDLRKIYQENANKKREQTYLEEVSSPPKSIRPVRK
jgi:hypothetical protein